MSGVAIRMTPCIIKHIIKQGLLSIFSSKVCLFFIRFPLKIVEGSQKLAKDTRKKAC